MRHFQSLPGVGKTTDVLCDVSNSSAQAVKPVERRKKFPVWMHVVLVSLALIIAILVGLNGFQNASHSHAAPATAGYAMQCANRTYAIRTLPSPVTVTFSYHVCYDGSRVYVDRLDCNLYVVFGSASNTWCGEVTNNASNIEVGNNYNFYSWGGVFQYAGYRRFRLNADGQAYGGYGY